MTLRLQVLPEPLAVCRFGSADPVPAWAAGPFLSVTRTPDELSVVCRDADVPEDVRAERGWRAFKVEGPLDFGLTGVLGSLAGPLAEAGIPVFAMSTFDTDYLLVRQPRLAEAIAALRRASHEVEP